MNPMIVKTTAVCVNANGEVEFVYAPVSLSNDDYSLGEHYYVLQRHAEEQGYKVLATFDEHEAAAKQVTLLASFLGKARTEGDMLFVPQKLAVAQ